MQNYNFISYNSLLSRSNLRKCDIKNVLAYTLTLTRARVTYNFPLQNPSPPHSHQEIP